MNRTKVTVACQACQKKKVKCTGSAPCTTCSRSGHKCIFSNTAKKRGPRNGNVEVIRNSAHRLEYVLQHYPSLRDQIEQMLESNGNKNNNNNNKRSSQSRQQDHVIVIDDDKINNRLSSFPYLVPNKSKDDISIKPQRRQDQVNRQENHQSPVLCRPLPVYPCNMQRNHVMTDNFSSKRSDINRYAQTGPPTSHSNISEVANSATNPLLQPIIANMEKSSIKVQNPEETTIENRLTLPAPYNTPNMAKRNVSMSIYNSSLGTQLLLPAPDLGNPLDFLQKSLISNPSQRQEGSTSSNHNNNNNNDNNSLEHGRIITDLNEVFKKKDEKKSIASMKISLPSPPSYLSSSSSPRSTSTNYCPPTPSSSSPPLSPHIHATSYTPKRSSIHLLSKPAPWCAHDHSPQENTQQKDHMEIDGSY
jgi:hypothetical protein